MYLPQMVLLCTSVGGPGSVLYSLANWFAGLTAPCPTPDRGEAFADGRRARIAGASPVVWNCRVLLAAARQRSQQDKGGRPFALG